MERKQSKASYLDEYSIIRHLGAGYQAQVKLAADSQGKLVAIKIYKPLTCTLETLQQELKVMQEMHHQNLIQLISVRENAVSKSQSGVIDKCFAIVLEYAGGGELFDYIAQTGKFSEKVTRTYFHQMMNGVHYMHEKGYAHRDIKPENILLSDNFVLKIADFGFSCMLKGKDGTGVLHTRLGTEGYMAPEIGSHEYNGSKVDIFACGVILFIMYSGNPPFEKASPSDPYFKLLMDHREKYFWQGHSRHRPEGFFSDSFRNLFEKLVAVEPKERLNINEIAKHPWVKASICTHSEIIDEFADRKKRMEKAIEERRFNQQKQRLKRMEAIQNHVSYTFSEEEVISQDASEKEREDDNFVQTYSREKLNNRIVQSVQEAGCEDLIVKNLEVEYVVSSLKEFLRTHELLLVDSELLQEEVDKLKVVQLMDSLRQIEVTYKYHLQLQQSITAKVVVLIRIGRLSPHELCIHFERMQGDKLYFKRIVKELKHGCFA